MAVKNRQLSLKWTTGTHAHKCSELTRVVLCLFLRRWHKQPVALMSSFKSASCLCLSSEFSATRLLSRVIGRCLCFIFSHLVLEMVGQFQVAMRVVPPSCYTNRVKHSCESWLTCWIYSVPALRLCLTALWFGLEMVWGESTELHCNWLSWVWSSFQRGWFLVTPPLKHVDGRQQDRLAACTQ